MKLTVLGSGTAVIRKQRKSACYLVEMGKKLILLDAGLGITNIPQTKYDLQKIDHIFISHPHVDHMGSLINILQSMLVSGLYYPKTKRIKPLTLHGYKGFKNHYETLRGIMFPERKESYILEVFDYLNHSRKFGDLTVKSTEIHHNPDLFNAVSYRLEYDGKILVYSGDCGFDERLIKLAKNADIAILEMAVSPEKFKKNGPLTNHISPYECGLMAKNAKVKKLVLVHWYDDTPQGIILKEVQKNFTGEIIIPDDLDTIKF